MKVSKITIAGLGLIGGSLAKAFRRTNPDFAIAGVDRDRTNLDQALKEAPSIRHMSGLRMLSQILRSYSCAHP